jgi:hypothetical protein
MGGSAFHHFKWLNYVTELLRTNTIIQSQLST